MSTIDQLKRSLGTGTGSERLSLYRVLRSPRLLLVPILLLLLVMFVGPMLIPVLFSLQSGNALSLNPAAWSLASYTEFVNGMISGSGVYGVVLSTTVYISALTVVFSLLIGYPAAYALARKIHRFKIVLIALVVLPLLTSVTMRMLGWTMFLMKDGVLFSLLGFFGYTPPTMLYKSSTILLGTTYTYLPFMLFPIYLSMLSISESLYTASEDLGASRLKLFRDVVWPMSKPGVIIGSLLVFSLSLGASVEAELLGGGSASTMATNIGYSFGVAQNFPLGSVQAVSLLLIAGFSGVYILRRLDLEEIAARSGGAAGHASARNSRTEDIVWYGYIGLVSLFLMLPMIAIIIASIHDARVFALPYDFTLDWYRRAVTNGSVRSAITNTLKIAVPVTILSTIVGTSAAIGYTRYDFRGQELFKIFVLLPIFFPLLIIGLGMSMWSNVIGLGNGIPQTIIAEMVWISPIVMFVVSITALGIDPNIEEAARDLGASTPKLYRDITLPLLADGIISGAIFAFVLVWNNYHIASYMSGANTIVTTWIHSRLTQGFSALVPGVAGVLFFISSLAVVFAFWIEYRG